MLYQTLKKKRSFPQFTRSNSHNTDTDFHFTNLMLVDSEQIFYETFFSDIEGRVFFISVKKSLKWNHFSNFLLYTL